MEAALPEAFRRTIISLYGDAGTAWLRALPQTIAGFTRRWGLQVGSPFALSYHYVAPALRTDGTPAVLKLGVPADRELRSEADALRLLDGGGAVRLLDADLDRGAVLLERCEPGTTLTALVMNDDDQRATAAAGAVLAALRRPAPREHPFVTQEDWGRGLARHRAAHQGTAGPLPSARLAEAERRFAELCATTTQRVVLHGDLHHDNVLAAQRTPWLAIDPKGVVGDPAYEPGALLRNPWNLLLALPDPGGVLDRRIDQLAEQLDLDRERIRGWAFAQAVLSAVWSLEDHGEASAFALACADLLSPPSR